jgi:hypothetical protein
LARCAPSARCASSTHAVAACAAAGVLTHADDALAAACATATPSGVDAACAQLLGQLAALDPPTAAAVANGLGPVFSVATLLFIIRRAPGSREQAAALQPRRAAVAPHARVWPAADERTDQQDCDDVVPQHQGRRVPLDHRLRAHGAAAGAHAQAHHARRVRAHAAGRRAAGCSHHADAPPAVPALAASSGVDTSPIVWVALISFMNEILLGKQGLLVLLSQKVA